MVAAPAKEVKVLLCERMDELIRTGTETREAASEALEALRSEGYQSEIATLLDEQRVAIDIWRDWNSDNRDENFPPKRDAPGPRRVDLSMLRSLNCVMETLHYVSGQWVTLGDMLKGDCVALATYWRDTEAEARAKAEFMEKVADRLAEGQRVRDVFTDADLRGL